VHGEARILTNVGWMKCQHDVFPWNSGGDQFLCDGTRRAVVLDQSLYSLGVENDLRCATHTPAGIAQVNAQAKAQVKAQVIFPRTSVASEIRRKSFCQLRKSFCLRAQAILP
jgi:hypothetical protein